MEALAVARREQCRDGLVGVIGIALWIGHALDEGIGRGSNGLLVQQPIEQRAAPGDGGLDHDEAPAPPQYALGLPEEDGGKFDVVKNIDHDYVRRYTGRERQILGVG